jgi:hypothetical protein
VVIRLPGAGITRLLVLGQKKIAGHGRAWWKVEWNGVRAQGSNDRAPKAS